MAASQPDPANLIAQLRLDEPLIGVYDAPDPAPYTPLVVPKAGGACVFRFRPRWLKGETVHLTREHYGCGGFGRQVFGVETRSRDDFIDFLYGDEGLRATRELMAAWIDHGRPYRPQHENIMVGPLRALEYRHLKTVVFWANADQLALLLQAAHYAHRPGEPEPVTAPFGSSCMEILPLFTDLDAPQAVIGATDIAMRDAIPRDVLAFTVTKSMFERVVACADDPHSFFHKGFLERLRKARAGEAPAG